jgi:hypothetical protein
MTQTSRRPRKAPSTGLAGWVLTFALAGAAIPAQGAGGADLSRLVVAGDSLSAGYQNSQLLESGQKAGYANLVATQAGVDLHLPLVLAPGFPQVSFTPGPFVTIVGIDPLLSPWLIDRQTHDLAVPGYTLQAFVGLPAPCFPTSFAPPATLQAPFPIEFMASQILNPGCRSTGATQLALAAGLKPSTAIMWIGSNDVLFPLLFGVSPTKTADFAGMYLLAISTMAHSSKKLVVATIPDVTLLPYLTSVPDLVAILSQGPPLPVSPSDVPALIGLQPGDKITPYAFPLITTALSTQTPLPEVMADPTSPTGFVPVVVRSKQLSAIRQAVLAYNAIIYTGALLTGATVVDINSLVNKLAANGVMVNGQPLTTAFMGGLFSLDGVHPTNIGYAVIANEFIKTMNRRLNTQIPPVSLEQVAAAQGGATTQLHVSSAMADLLRGTFAH